MDAKLVYAKTPSGDEAVRQSTRVVQRNLRMVLVQVDGKLNVEELSIKMANPRLVKNALRELEEGGFIAPALEAASVWEESMRQAAESAPAPPLSAFSTFDPKPAPAANTQTRPAKSAGGHFSSFGKPILPTAAQASRQEPSIKTRLGQGDPAVAPEPEERERRPFPWRWVKRGVYAALLLLVALVFFYPYDNLKPEFEASASRLLQTPVRIGKLGATFWPRPALTLASVRIGEAGGSSIDEVRVLSPWSLLGSAPHVISAIDVEGATLASDLLVSLPMFRDAMVPTDGGLVLRRLRFEQLTVTAGSLSLKELSGDVSFTPTGGFDKAKFERPDRSLRLSILPSQQGLILNAEGLAWKPAGTDISFDALQAKGLLQKGRLVIQDFDSTMLGGVIKGSWMLDWSNGLLMAGDASLKRLDCRKVAMAFSPGLKLDGELAGSLRLRSSGRDWDGLWSNVEAVLDADVSRGVLIGLDLGEVARRGAGSIVRAGATKFDHLRGSLNVSSRQIVGRNVQMSAGMVTASGQFAAGRDQSVDGNLVVTMQTSVATVRTPVRVSGILPDLTANATQ